MRRPVTESGRTRTYRVFSPGAQGYRGRARSRARWAGSVMSARVPRTTTLQPVRVASSIASTSKATDSRSVAASSLDPGSVRKTTRSLVEHVVDREDHRPAEVWDGQAAEVPLGQQLAALGVVEFLHVGLGHAGTSLGPDTNLEGRRWRGVGVPLEGPGGTGRAVGPLRPLWEDLYPCCHVRPLTVIATDLTAAPAELVERYAGRSIVEVLFGEARQIAGIGKLARFAAAGP